MNSTRHPRISVCIRMKRIEVSVYLRDGTLLQAGFNFNAVELIPDTLKSYISY